MRSAVRSRCARLGVDERDGDALDQDAVALAAGSVVSAVGDVGHLPPGEVAAATIGCRFR